MNVFVVLLSAATASNGEPHTISYFIHKSLDFPIDKLYENVFAIRCYYYVIIFVHFSHSAVDGELSEQRIVQILVCARKRKMANPS